ncbi:hypothetical protein BWB39_10375 [Salmonella enterica subsp. enterica serovar Enteritidis]|nr:hypothetical protein [Salmonella enterica subsp. enterica serovar Enteritidis]EDE1794102.1 hypothetical protein [Salmonella enterica subsp. enterica serovar Enteritidis]EGW3960807.1 hypothetical protein [Salmonella enterica subsp. enterica serovar Enteritidis]
MSNKIVFVNGKSKYGCVMAFSDGGGEYSDVHTTIPCAEHSMSESTLTQRDDMRQALEQREEAEKQVEELTMWLKRLTHSLRNARPNSKLHGAAMDYLRHKGLISVEDILR